MNFEFVVSEETERSNLFEENVRLAIANIDNALSTIPVVVLQSVQPSVSGSMLTDGGHTGSESSPPRATVVNSSASTPNKTQVKLPETGIKEIRR